MIALLVMSITVGCDTGEAAMSETEAATARSEQALVAEPDPVTPAPGVTEGMMGGLRFFDVYSNNFVGDPNRRALTALVATNLQQAAYDGNVQQALMGPRTRRVLQYMAECALPPGSHVDFWSSNRSWSGRFEGVGGMAPEWASGWCNEHCQQTVSACLFSRINGDDRVVNLNVRRHVAGGGHPVDQFWKDHYQRLEAAYWGNYFYGANANGLLDMHACFGFDAAGSDPRVALFRKRYCGEFDSSVACHAAIAGPCGSTRTCPLARADGFAKQCKGGPWDPDQAVSACSPQPWDNACTSTATMPADYPTVTVFRADRCAHTDFQVGGPLDRECSPCAEQVAAGPHGRHCTSEAWGQECVDDARRLCAQAFRDAGQPILTGDPSVSAVNVPLRLGTSDLVDGVCKDANLGSCCQFGSTWTAACADRARWCLQPANTGSATCAPTPIF